MRIINLSDSQLSLSLPRQNFFLSKNEISVETQLDKSVKQQIVDFIARYGANVILVLSDDEKFNNGKFILNLPSSTVESYSTLEQVIDPEESEEPEENSDAIVLELTCDDGTQWKYTSSSQPEELVQVDWSQNDENAPDYIKNRICSDAGDKILLTGNVIISSATVYAFDATSEVLPEPTAGSKLYLRFSSLTEVFETKWTYDGDYGFTFSLSSIGGACGGNNTDYPNKIHFTGGGGGESIPFSEGDTFTLFEKNIQQISEDFIPDTIVRTSQLGGAMFKVVNTALQVSLDGGSTWKTVSLEEIV